MTALRSLCRPTRLLDVPAVLELLRFRTLRRRYYERFWHRAARSIGAGAALAFVVVVLGGLLAKTFGTEPAATTIVVANIVRRPVPK